MDSELKVKERLNWDPNRDLRPADGSSKMLWQELLDARTIIKFLTEQVGGAYLDVLQLQEMLEESQLGSGNALHFLSVLLYKEWARANRLELSVAARDRKLEKRQAHIDRKDREIVAAKTKYKKVLAGFDRELELQAEYQMALDFNAVDTDNKPQRSEERTTKSIKLNDVLSSQYARLRSAVAVFGSEINSDTAPRRALFDLVDAVEALDKEHREAWKPLSKETRLSIVKREEVGNAN